jgi:hypothetical protein
MKHRGEGGVITSPPRFSYVTLPAKNLIKKENKYRPDCKMKALPSLVLNKSEYSRAYLAEVALLPSLY